MKFTLLFAPAALVLFAAQGLAQSVTETRIFQQEYVDTGVGAAATWWLNADIGLQGPTEIGHGQVESFEVELSVEWNVNMLVVNGHNAPAEFLWSNAMNLSPKVGDCSAYDRHVTQATSGLLNPGDAGFVSFSDVQLFQNSGTNFQVNCDSNVWTWTDLFLWNGINPFGPFTYSGGFQVPRSWVRINDFGATLDGHITIEWTPDPVPSTSQCPGNSTTGAELMAGGDHENLWLMQSGAPNTLNLLLQSDAASSIVPSNGLCVGGGVAMVTRLNESLSFGGEPYRLPYAQALAGTTQYFQAWYRGTNGGAESGECIGITFP
ncbi:MAG: hypothetical protein P1V35_02635 [Planctomycetota bacterium]|nr:hypothetical protein [Planctomycetota bacterium]